MFNVVRIFVHSRCKKVREMPNELIETLKQRKNEKVADFDM